MFDELGARWPDVCGRCGVEVCSLPRVNQTLGEHLRYSAALRDAVGELCCMDVERFCFALPDSD